MFARSYALAPVSALAPYEYTMLPWGVVFGFLLFGDLPSWNTLVGAVVVAASGTYNVYRERVRRVEERAAAIKAVSVTGGQVETAARRFALSGFGREPGAEGSTKAEPCHGRSARITMTVTDLVGSANDTNFGRGLHAAPGRAVSVSASCNATSVVGRDCSFPPCLPLLK